MSIKEDIIKFTTGLNTTTEKAIKYATFNRLNMFNQLNDIRRYVQKDLKGEKELQLDSQILRTYITVLDKVLKALNKKISHVEIKNRIISQFEKAKKKDSSVKEIDYRMIYSECRVVGDLIKTAQYLYACYVTINHYALLAYLIEQEKLYRKIKSDEVLQTCLEETIRELREKNI